ncbi:MAG TPA: hypothetical protein VKG26_15375, partial [Bacteroidia bacterium]|nr:hypothetical protein [Bacteroidia bacterium]
ANLEHRTITAGDYSYYCEKKYGDNYALIGDAGAFLDPIFSSGVYVAMQSGELVADALHAKLTTGSTAEIDATYKQINGAVGLLEKFIRLFYTPEDLNFSTLGNPNYMLYNKFETAYTIFHYLLAGDFFVNYEKYSRFIDEVRNEKTMVKFQSLIKHKKDADPESKCGESFEEMYGRMTHKVVFDESFM